MTPPSRCSSPLGSSSVTRIRALFVDVPSVALLLTTMETFKSLWLLLTIFAAFFHSGLCIRCYQCTSQRDPKCADPISGDLRATECTRDSVRNTLNEITYTGSGGISDVFSGSMFSCLKINSLKNNQYQNMTVIRGCYYEKMDGRDICTMLRSKVIDQTTLPFCETCTGDACNGSNRISSSVSLASMFLPLAVFYYFIRQ